MVLRYELFVCHSDKTWSDGHFIEIDGSYIPDGDADALAIETFKSENPKMDMVFVGVYHSEEREEFSEE
jgi:hypothetical protein